MVIIVIAIFITRFGCDVDMRQGPSFSAIPVPLMKCQSEEALVRMMAMVINHVDADDDYHYILDVVTSIIFMAGEHSQPLLGVGCKLDQDCVKLAQLRRPQVPLSLAVTVTLTITVTVTMEISKHLHLHQPHLCQQVQEEPREIVEQVVFLAKSSFKSATDFVYFRCFRQASILLFSISFC